MGQLCKLWVSWVLQCFWRSVCHSCLLVHCDSVWWSSSAHDTCQHQSGPFEEDFASPTGSTWSSSLNLTDEKNPRRISFTKSGILGQDWLSVALSWIHWSPANYKNVVGNRVREIQDLVSLCNWYSACHLTILVTVQVVESTMEVYWHIHCGAQSPLG